MGKQTSAVDRLTSGYKAIGKGIKETFLVLIGLGILLIFVFGVGLVVGVVYYVVRGWALFEPGQEASVGRVSGIGVLVSLACLALVFGVPYAIAIYIDERRAKAAKDELNEYY